MALILNSPQVCENGLEGGRNMMWALWLVLCHGITVRSREKDHVVNWVMERLTWLVYA